MTVTHQSPRRPRPQPQRPAPPQLPPAQRRGPAGGEAGLAAPPRGGEAGLGRRLAAGPRQLRGEPTAAGTEQGPRHGAGRERCRPQASAGCPEAPGGTLPRRHLQFWFRWPENILMTIVFVSSVGFSSCSRYRQGLGCVVFVIQVLVPRKCHPTSDLFLLKQKLLKCMAENIKLNNNAWATVPLPGLCCKERGVKTCNIYCQPINKGNTF